MKLFNPSPTYIIRLQIVKQGEQTEYINLEETTIEEVKVFLEEILKRETFSPFETGRVTSINIREALGGKNGKATSISFRGFSPQYIHDLIIKNIPN